RIIHPLRAVHHAQRIALHWTGAEHIDEIELHELPPETRHCEERSDGSEAGHRPTNPLTSPLDCRGPLPSPRNVGTSGLGEPPWTRRPSNSTRLIRANGQKPCRTNTAGSSIPSSTASTRARASSSSAAETDAMRRA